MHYSRIPILSSTSYSATLEGNTNPYIWLFRTHSYGYILRWEWGAGWALSHITLLPAEHIHSTALRTRTIQQSDKPSWVLPMSVRLFLHWKHLRLWIFPMWRGKMNPMPFFTFVKPKAIMWWRLCLSSNLYMQTTCFLMTALAWCDWYVYIYGIIGDSGLLRDFHSWA